MIEPCSFLDIEELTKRRGHIEKLSKTMRGKRSGAGGAGDRKRA